MKTKVGPFTYETLEVTPDFIVRLPFNKVMGLDIETSKATSHDRAGLDPYQSNIRLVQIYDGKTCYVFDLQKYPALKEIVKGFLMVCKFIAHNGCFELKMLKHHFGFTPDIQCSMLMAMLIDRAEHSPFEPDELEELDDEEKPKSDHSYKKRGGYSLDACVARYFDLAVDKSLQVSDWSKNNLSREQIAYAALDAVLTYELGKKLYPQIQSYKMGKAYKLLQQMQYVVTEMELNGMGFDAETHLEMNLKWGEEVRKADKVAKKYFAKLNLNSPKQLGEWLEKYNSKLASTWPKTDKGAYTFSRNKISEHWKFPPIAALLEYKHWVKLFNTYGESLVEKLNPATKRIHCEFFLGETRTGRLSARNPNLQNLPRDGDFRKVFRAAKNCSLVIADFSQIEMRVAGELSRDPTMLEAFEKGTDLHKAIVSAIAKKPISKVTDEERQLGKAINFGLLFGMGPKKLTLYARISYGVTLSEEQALEAWSIFHKSMYPKYSAWCEIQRRNCERLGFVRTPMGKMRKLLTDEVYTKAVNTPVQGGAAEVAYCGLVRLRERMNLMDPRAKIINMVHDEIILEVPEGAEAIWGNALTNCMKQGYLDVFPNGCTTGLAESFYGDTWYDCKHKETRKPCL